MNYRLLRETDFNKGFLDLLNQLTIIGDITEVNFKKQFYDILKNKNHKIYVLEKNEKIISC